METDDITPDEQAVEQQPDTSGVTLGVADLQNVIQIIDVALARGAFRGAEAGTVGAVYEKLTEFVKQTIQQTSNADKT